MWHRGHSSGTETPRRFCRQSRGLCPAARDVVPVRRGTAKQGLVWGQTEWELASGAEEEARGE